jgi:type I restriction enzyme M protein
MAKRPVYLVGDNLEEFVKEREIEFEWFSGFSISQKKKSIQSFHKNIKEKYPKYKILEISTKSESELGVKLSAFNLMIVGKNKKYSVESAFQGSKIFEKGGPYRDLFYMSSKEAKQDERLKSSGKLIAFDFFGTRWELEPKTLFYDWLYINTVAKNSKLAEKIIEYDAFTDIEFNPKKSVNNQAKAAALYVFLHRNNLLQIALSSPDGYKKIIKGNYEKKVEKEMQLTIF